MSPPPPHGEPVSDAGDPVVSVVIPALNAAWCLRDQLHAVLRQESAVPFEVIVADNGSSDGTAALALGAGARTVVVEHPRNPATARNLGAAHARGSILLFLDADDVVAAGYIRAMVGALEHVDIAGARVGQTTLNPGWRQFSRTIDQVDGLPVVSTGPRSGTPWVYGATLGIRAEAFATLGGFDGALAGGEDIDLSLRAHEMGLRMGFVGDAVVECRLRSTFGGVLRQGVKYGWGGAALHAKYKRLGVPLEPPGTTSTGSLRWTVAPVRNLLSARDRAALSRAVFLLGRRAGYVVGNGAGRWRRPRRSDEPKDASGPLG